MKSIVVFCGSSEGNKPEYIQEGYKLGQTLAEQGITLVYGGAKIGVMGAIAEGALAANGKVIGVIPDFLKIREVFHTNLTEFVELVLDDLYNREWR